MESGFHKTCRVRAYVTKGKLGIKGRLFVRDLDWLMFVSFFLSLFFSFAFLACSIFFLFISFSYGLGLGRIINLWDFFCLYMMRLCCLFFGMP
jgi:hypothetical protein